MQNLMHIKEIHKKAQLVLSFFYFHFCEEEKLVESRQLCSTVF